MKNGLLKEKGNLHIILTSNYWRQKEKESRKRKNRQSLGRRVSFSSTVDVRHFYKGDDQWNQANQADAHPAPQ